MPNTDNGPQNGLGGSSYLYDFGSSPNTRVAVSQKSRILTPHYGDTQAMAQMGVLGTFTPNESRTIEPVRGIGFGDKIAELVPSVTEPATIDFERALLYLCNLWQATGYAGGVDGPVRSLSHHKWPFDIEHQLVFSTLADVDLGAANVGVAGVSGTFQGGVKQIGYPQVTPDSASSGYAGGNPGANSGHSAIITIYEACWFNAHGVTYAKDQGLVMETGNATVSAIHDFASMYGEFLATGNDPTLGQLGSIRFAAGGFSVGQVGTGVGGGGNQSIFATLSGNNNPV
jgi:hypothetical protein